MGWSPKARSRGCKAGEKLVSRSSLCKLRIEASWGLWGGDISGILMWGKWGGRGAVREAGVIL